MSETSKAWVDATLPILNAIGEAGVRESIDIDSLFRVPGDADFYIDVVTDLSSTDVDEQLIALYLPTVDADGVVDALAARVTAGGDGPTDSRVIRWLLKVPMEWPWDVLVKAATESLQVPSDIADDQLRACLVTLLILEDVDPDAKTALAQTVQGGFMLHHVESARANPDFRAAALCVLAHLLASPDGEIATAVGNAAQGQQWYRSFAEAPDSTSEKIITFLADAVREFWDGRELLLTGRDSSVAAPIVARVIETLVAQEQFHPFVPARAIVEGYTFLEQHLTSALGDVLAASNREGALLAEILKAPFSSDLCGLYEWALSEETARDAALPHIERGLEGISREDWLTALSKSGCVLNVTMLAVQYERAPLSTPFSDALIDEVRTVLENGSEFAESIRRGNLAQALTDEARGVFYRRLRDTLIDYGSRPLSTVLAEYGNELDESQALDDPTAADRFVLRVLGEIVDRQVADELRWAANAVQDHPGLMEFCDAATAEQVRDRLRAELESPREGSVAPYLTTLATALGVATSGESKGEAE